jgi:hypothetical protein
MGAAKRRNAAKNRGRSRIFCSAGLVDRGIGLFVA